jgi:protein-tyrosine phosphatase
VSEQSIGVLFVCLGNICRSPSAQGIAERLAQQRGWSKALHIDSCGTAAFNIGKAPDPRAVEAAVRRGYDISSQRARQIEAIDYQRHDYVIAMDRMNLTNVQAWAPEDFAGEIHLLMNYGKHRGVTQVPDPFYDDAGKFDQVVEILEKATTALLDHIGATHNLDGNLP